LNQIKQQKKFKLIKIINFFSEGPGKDKLLNGDEILAINDEDVEFASREHVITLIRKSVNKIKLVVKQPTV
jgi:PDZ domain-containing secreted protein